MKARKRGDEAGIALVYVVLTTMVILGALAVVSERVINAKRVTDAAVTRVALDEACKAGVDYAVEQIWNQYLEDQGGEVGNLASYRAFIADVVGTNEDLNRDGDADEDEFDSNGNGVFDQADPLVMATAQAPILVGEPGSARLTSLTVTRRDDFSGTDMIIRATAEYFGETRTAEQTVRVGGQPFEGFEYGVMSNNINCILCHAEIKSLPLENNADPTRYNTFSRVKVATLESLLFRITGAHSEIAGTVYTRGDVMDQYGNDISADTLASSTLNGYEFDPNNGMIVQDASGNMNEVSLVDAQLDEEGMLEEGQNLYKNYPDDPDLMTDGTIPSSFPAPYTDPNENRYVDDDEFGTFMASANGSITGGVAYGVPNDGTLYDQASFPTTSNDATTSLANGNYDGNLVLVGTEADPIEIDGTVAINGDLVIKGYVKGSGKLMVRNNSYVAGDVVYADAADTFGYADDGTENALALVSGGSTLMGDYLSVRGKNKESDQSKYPNKSYSIQTRVADKTQTWNGETMHTGYFDPGVTDPGEIQETMTQADGTVIQRDGHQFSFTTSELMLFNNLEIDKAAADPNYRPRFYGIREGQPDNIYVYDDTDEHSVRYDRNSDGVKLLTDYMIEQGIPLDLLDDASFHYMNPQGNWLSEDILRQMWWDDEQARPDNTPFQFDGLLYSNNAIFAVTRSKSRHGSHTNAKMLLRGSIIAPDLGVLSANGFELQYDPRVRRFYQLEDTTIAAFRRAIYRTVQGDESALEG